MSQVKALAPESNYVGFSLEPRHLAELPILRGNIFLFDVCIRLVLVVEAEQTINRLVFLLGLGVRRNLEDAVVDPFFGLAEPLGDTLLQFLFYPTLHLLQNVVSFGGRILRCGWFVCALKDTRKVHFSALVLAQPLLEQVLAILGQDVGGVHRDLVSFKLSAVVVSICNGLL